jgi:chromosomal replication initiation ATPase DnaA
MTPASALATELCATITDDRTIVSEVMDRLGVYMSTARVRELRAAVRPAGGPLMASHVIGIVSDRMKVPVDCICGAGALRLYVRARWAVVYILRKHRPNMSYTQIGRLLGGRHPATLIHAFRGASALIANDHDFASLVQDVEARL